jgi:hypothetical protein
MRKPEKSDSDKVQLHWTVSAESLGKSVRSRFLFLRAVLGLSARAADRLLGLLDVLGDFALVDFELDSLPIGLRIVNHCGAKPPAVEPQSYPASDEQQQDE